MDNKVLFNNNHASSDNVFSWRCRVCNKLNKPDDVVCSKCGTRKSKQQD